ncbi:unnamed protein product [Ambrosiozyma monospora]|uniref:DASH complex subunit DAM1 n=1 Tax=Ambrosiozyma monospora TaxID=43982 RepID=A0A9W6YUU4_AMBMO|nr:unnamed protein product [Ambrosiozyma monospora]
MRSSRAPTDPRLSRLPTVRPATPKRTRSSLYPQIQTSSPPSTTPQTKALNALATSPITPLRQPSNPRTSEIHETNGTGARIGSVIGVEDGAVTMTGSGNNANFNQQLPPLPQQLTPLNPTEFPFFTSQKQKDFLKALKGTRREFTRLNKVNKSLNNVNESMAALLFGLNINAWCVHFDESPTTKTWGIKEEIDLVDSKISNLKKKIQDLQNQKRNTDRSKMPPPANPTGNSGNGGGGNRRIFSGSSVSSTGTSIMRRQAAARARSMNGGPSASARNARGNNMNTKVPKTPLKTPIRRSATHPQQRVQPQSQRRQQLQQPQQQQQQSTSTSTSAQNPTPNTPARTPSLNKVRPRYMDFTLGTPGYSASTKNASRRYSSIPVRNAPGSLRLNSAERRHTESFETFLSDDNDNSSVNGGGAGSAGFGSSSGRRASRIPVPSNSRFLKKGNDGWKVKGRQPFR